jgi:hypothetical protein
MSRTIDGPAVSPSVLATAASPFALPAARRRIGVADRRAEGPPGRLLLMLAVAFLLASPVISLLLAVP